MATTVLQNPFLDAVDVVMPSTEQAAASSPPKVDAAAALFPRGFDPEKFLADIEEPMA